MDRIDFRFAERLRVRWAEIDAQKIVFNGHYLMYFDTAIAGYWRAMALPYHEAMSALEGDLYVRKATLEYLGSARYDDSLNVGVRCQRIGNSSIQFECGVFRNGELLVSGELIYVFADPTTQTSRPVPEALREAMNAYESGAEMLTLRLGSWAEVEADARAVRTEVFIDEQGISPELEWDANDTLAVHAVAYNRLGMPLGTARALTDAKGCFRIGRLAVTASLRNAGIGARLLDRLIVAVQAQGARQIVLSAQTSAVSFYSRAGFTQQGDVFHEAGIAHIEMVRSL